MVTTNETIPNGKLNNKRRRYSVGDTPNKPGLMSKIPNHPEVRFTMMPVITSRVDLVENKTIKVNNIRICGTVPQVSNPIAVVL